MTIQVQSLFTCNPDNSRDNLHLNYFLVWNSKDKWEITKTGYSLYRFGIQLAIELLLPLMLYIHQNIVDPENWTMC